MKEIPNRIKSLCRSKLPLLRRRSSGSATESVEDIPYVERGPEIVEELIKSLQFFNPHLQVVVEGLSKLNYEPITLMTCISGEPDYPEAQFGIFAAPRAGVYLEPYTEQTVVVIDGSSPGGEPTQRTTVGELIEELRFCEQSLRIFVGQGDAFEPIALGVRIAGESPPSVDPNLLPNDLVDAAVGKHRNPYCKREVLVISSRYRPAPTLVG